MCRIIFLLTFKVDFKAFLPRTTADAVHFSNSAFQNQFLCSFLGCYIGLETFFSSSQFIQQHPLNFPFSVDDFYKLAI